jgi:hypothetical protein
MQKVAQGKDVKIIALGGSFTAGHDCKQRIGEKLLDGLECSWSARFVKWLKTFSPSANNIAFHSFAQGGTTSSALLGGIGIILRSPAAKDADLVLLDTMVNDAFEVSTTSEAAGTAMPNELVKTRRSMNLTIGDSISINYEKLVQSVRTLLPRAAMYALLAACGSCLLRYPHQLKVLQHYELPFLNWADVVEKANQSQSDERRLWYPAGETHAYWRTHQYIADGIAYTWATALSDSNCSKKLESSSTWPSSPLWPEDKSRLYSVCLWPTSAFVAGGEQTAEPLITSGSWKLFEDRPGKPGWIADSPRATIEFPLTFGAKPTLAITWLRSYTDLGMVNMTLNRRSIVLDGLWGVADANVSQRHTRWFDVFSDRSELGGFSIRPHSSATLRFELLETPPERSPKFKITDVVSC